MDLLYFNRHRGADICKKCWLFMVVAMKIVDSALESKFFQNIVFILGWC